MDFGPELQLILCLSQENIINELCIGAGHTDHKQNTDLGTVKMTNVEILTKWHCESS